jgi:hypothetical protein
MVCVFRKAFLKSDTAVALRRIGSKIPCITLVSLINVYYEYFCKVIWLSAKSPDVFGIIEHNVPMYTEIVLCKYELYQTKTYMCCVP